MNLQFLNKEFTVLGLTFLLSVGLSTEAGTFNGTELCHWQICHILIYLDSTFFHETNDMLLNIPLLLMSSGIYRDKTLMCFEDVCLEEIWFI